MSAKSDKISLEFREAGNKCVENKDYIKALMKYNASLCYAKSKEYAAMAYANRSAVFLKIGMYCECLENVRWAQEHNYPKNKASKLQEREEYCYQKISGSETSKVYEDLDKATNFFKLSHPPNPRIPFIADCLEYRLSDNGKMAIFTKIDLKAGDIIAMEKPVYSMVFNNAKYKRCIMCATTKKFNLIPCEKTSSVMFCSKECQSWFDAFSEIFCDSDDTKKISWDIFQEVVSRTLTTHAELGTLSEHQEIWKGKLKKSIFDYDTTDPIFKKGTHVSNCIASLSSEPVEVDDVSTCVKAVADICQTMFRRSLCTEIYERHGVNSRNHFSSLSILLPLFNHNCSNNIDVYTVDDANVLIANHRIRANSELFTVIFPKPSCEEFMSYLPFQPECKEVNSEKFFYIPLYTLNDLDKCIEQLKLNWKLVNELDEGHFILRQGRENFLLISSIAHRITHPCFLSCTDYCQISINFHALEIED